MILIGFLSHLTSVFSSNRNIFPLSNMFSVSLNTYNIPWKSCFSGPDYLVFCVRLVAYVLST